MSAVQNLIDRLTGRQREREQSATEAYSSLVNRLADGDEPKESEAQKTLDNAGRSADDLEHDVALIVQRREAAARLAELPELREASRDAHQAVLAEIASFEKLQAQHKTRLADLRLAESRAVAAMAQVGVAQRTLSRTAPPELSEAVADAKQRTFKLAGKIERAEADLVTTGSELARAEQAAKSAPPDNDWPARAEQLRRREAAETERLAALRQEHVDALAAVDHAKAQKLAAV